MFIELEPIFNNEGSKFAFEYEIDCSSCEFGSRRPFVKPVKVSGLVGNFTGIVRLQAKACVEMVTECDRCACELKKQMTVPVEHILVTHLNDEENVEFILIEKMRFALDPLVMEDIFLSLPAKILCNNDCKGICPKCGANLNDGQCSCPKSTDPRLDVLKQLLDN